MLLMSVEVVLRVEGGGEEPRVDRYVILTSSGVDIVLDERFEERRYELDNIGRYRRKAQ